MSDRSHLSADWRNTLFEYKVHVTVSARGGRVVRSVELPVLRRLYRLEDDVRTTSAAGRIGVGEGRIGRIKYLSEPDNVNATFIGVNFSGSDVIQHFMMNDIEQLPVPTPTPSDSDSAVATDL
jgi:hypothetical protein